MNIPEIFNTKKSYFNNIMETNNQSQSYGLVLKEKDVMEILNERESVLQDQGRVELEIGITVKIIEFLCSSPYVDKIHYTEEIIELQEIYYYLKTETNDKIPDNKLLKIIFNLYNNPCNGSLELLKGREADRIINAVRCNESLPETKGGSNQGEF